MGRGRLREGSKGKRLIMDEIKCPVCNREFEVEEYSQGTCECGNKYWSDEQCTEDYSDCWTFYDWRWFDKGKMKEDDVSE